MSILDQFASIFEDGDVCVEKMNVRFSDGKFELEYSYPGGSFDELKDRGEQILTFLNSVAKNTSFHDYRVVVKSDTHSFTYNFDENRGEFVLSGESNTPDSEESSDHESNGELKCGDNPCPTDDAAVETLSFAQLLKSRLSKPVDEESESDDMVRIDIDRAYDDILTTLEGNSYGDLIFDEDTNEPKAIIVYCSPVFYDYFDTCTKGDAETFMKTAKKDLDTLISYLVVRLGFSKAEFYLDPKEYDDFQSISLRLDF